ncbi:MAG: repressor LexA [Myxococcaceae bacterium]|nr:repressor LexA [Myxococcaceae bacterium]MBH2005954.1 repressor LexA [Myxococcaceae bacterium]
MSDLTEKQKRALKVIEEFWEEKSLSPSIQDVATRLGIIRPTAYQHLKALKRKGFLKNSDRIGRSWQLTQNIGSIFKVPLLGRVAAGTPLLANENIEDYVMVSNSNQSSQCFALRIAGHSMMEGGILDRDIVIVRQQSSANDGDIVVALVDSDSATVKKFKRFTSQIGLMPMNQNYDPMILDPERVSILGKVIEVRRTIH